MLELCQRIRRARGNNFDLAQLILYVACQPMFSREAVNERSKTHTLHMP